jgi:hypothetical protein
MEQAKMNVSGEGFRRGRCSSAIETVVKPNTFDFVVQNGTIENKSGQFGMSEVLEVKPMSIADDKRQQPEQAGRSPIGMIRPVIGCPTDS